MINKISHVQIPVKDLHAAIKWYEQTLDCELIQDFGAFAVIRFKGDSVTIFLWKTSDETAANFIVNGEPFPVLGFQVNDMDELCSRVSRAGTKIHGDQLATPGEDGRRFLKFFDLDNNMLVAHTE